MHYDIMTPIQIGRKYATVSQCISSASEFGYGEQSVKQILDRLSNGTYIGMGAFEDDGTIMGFMTLSIVTYPNKRVLRIITLGGVDVEHWDKLDEALTAMAKQQECTALECWCRSGIARIVEKKLGGKVQYSVVTKEI